MNTTHSSVNKVQMYACKESAAKQPFQQVKIKKTDEYDLPQTL